MLPLISGRRLVARIGSGPMKSAFHYSSHKDLNKQILHPAFARIGIAERMKGCATRALRNSTMCRLWHAEGELAWHNACTANACCLLHFAVFAPGLTLLSCICSCQEPHQGAVQA